ncbi:MAG: type I restriction enzyme HsdR N-terminal domain-containing protein [Saprospiraceae bacterium]
MNLVSKAIDLDLLRWKDTLEFTQRDNKVFVKDIIRKKYFMLQPEEFVRQLIVMWLINDCGIHRNRIQVEKAIDVHGTMKRFDIVVYDQAILPKILIECKSADVKIDQSTFDQIALYNMALSAPYLVLSNGLHSYIAKIDHDNQSYHFYDGVPKWEW